MRKLTAIILLITLFFTVCGYHFVYHFRITDAKAEMKKQLQLSRHRLDVVEFSFDASAAATLEWEEDHEFRYEGEMYDVIEKKMENGKLMIRCLSDKKEKELIDDYRRASDPQSSPLTSSLLKLIAAPFLASSLETPLVSVTYFNLFFWDFSPPVKLRPQTIVLPPPRVC